MYVIQDGRSNKSAKSAKTFRSGRTMLTTKTMFIDQAKKLQGPSLAPIGIEKPTEEDLQAQEKVKRMHQMMNETLTTEVLVEKILKIIDFDDELAEEWPLDAEPHKDLVKNLSHTKMINEINHKKPRGFSKAGAI